jgi:endonuclease/exonuclease/phosphatase family metal-dependent hydrolase
MSVLSLNTWLLPPPLAKDNRKRLRTIVRMIEYEDSDVVCLQEVWVNAYVRQLRSALPEYHFFTASDSLLFNRSGLVFASKEKPRTQESGHFPDSKAHSMSEKLMGKGWQLISFDNLAVLHTHLYASYGDTDYSMTKAQLQQLEALDLPANTVLVGDCNLPRDTFCKTTTRFTCPENTTHTIESSNPYADARLNNPSDDKWSYITPLKASDIAVNIRVRKKPVVSDHFALIAEVSV